MIGIIANPSSGKDIRRLVAQATVFDNMEKVNIIQRILSVIHASGLREICVMPDAFQIIDKACEHLKRSMKIDVEVKYLDILVENDQADSTNAARMLREMGACCIITLGGDGTNRAVAKSCGEVPLIPVSTGTNNVFPRMMEGTLAGMAAVVAERDKGKEWLRMSKRKCIKVYKNGIFTDIALVDAAITSDLYVGARALYDPSAISELLVTVAKPDCLGMSAIAGSVHPVEETDPNGVYVELGEKGCVETWVPMAPGVMSKIAFRGYREVVPYERILVKANEGMVALDGEREVPFNRGDRIELELSPDGPVVIDIHETLKAASGSGFFIECGEGSKDVLEGFSFYRRCGEESPRGI
ncbi:ATP-NAD kinase family protein [Youngiibacter fragilis]|uniref:ATP-NAD kinase n=1 Tax=Youngiibacter fragilis 232.1 TaxID=994573 RepID=V7I8C1_9CLOT|nr:NAD(+)/NADH kinase [Youngiibacter fragilis]ETA81531.1 ATP-NAD kinase [Youngiibacter fragilis 232.1]